MELDGQEHGHSQGIPDASPTEPAESMAACVADDPEKRARALELDGQERGPSQVSDTPPTVAAESRVASSADDCEKVARAMEPDGQERGHSQVAGELSAGYDEKVEGATDMEVDDGKLDPEGTAGETACTHTCTPLLEEDVVVQKDAIAKAGSEVVVVVEDEASLAATSALGEVLSAAVAQDAQKQLPASEQPTGPVFQDAQEQPSSEMATAAEPIPAKMGMDIVAAATIGAASIAGVVTDSAPFVVALPADEQSMHTWSFDVGVLLGSWVRDGGRTHTVTLDSVAGDKLGAVQFCPTGGSSPMPFARTEDTWSLNGYILDEARSTKDVLRWRHTASHAVRTWWRPESGAGETNIFLSSSSSATGV